MSFIDYIKVFKQAQPKAQTQSVAYHNEIPT